MLDRKHGRKVRLPHTSYPFHHHVPRSPVVYSRHDGPGKNLENCNFTTIDRDAYFTFRADPNSRLMYGYRLTIASALPHRGYVTTDQGWTFGNIFDIAERKKMQNLLTFRDKSIRVVIISKSTIATGYEEQPCPSVLSSFREQSFLSDKTTATSVEKRKREEEK